MQQKLDVGNVIQRVWETYQAQFSLLAQAALIVFIPIAILNALILTGGGAILILAAAAVGIIGSFLFQGMVVEAASDMLDGKRDHSVGSLFAAVSPVLAPLFVASLVAGLGIGLGLILLIVPGLYLLTIWAVIAPAVVLERKGAMDALGRSRELVRGHEWQVFGVIVVFFLIQIVVGGILQGIFGGIISGFVGYLIGDLLTRVLIAPLTALAAAIVYFELKRLQGEPETTPSGVTPAPTTTPAPPATPPPTAP
jgi:MFS family permease